MKKNTPDTNPTSPQKDSFLPSWKSLWGAAVIAIVIMALITATLASASIALFPKYDPTAHEKGIVQDEETKAVAEDGTEMNLEVTPPADEPNAPSRTPTKLVAKYQEIDIASPIATEDLTGVLFHQASYEYGLIMETKLPEADQSAALASNSTRINKGQRDGQWLDAEALHLYRVQDSTAMDTSIDVGADPGSIVYAPVSGTVVLVKDYMLYGYIPDIEIHIRPDGRDDLDLVVIHTTDPLVTGGEHVDAGITEISHVRDISVSMDGIQLDDYDGEEHDGNHAHVQINDANWPEYREKKLDGAVA